MNSDTNTKFSLVKLEKCYLLERWSMYVVYFVQLGNCFELVYSLLFLFPDLCPTNGLVLLFSVESYWEDYLNKGNRILLS